MALPLQTYTYINNILIGKRYLDHRGPFHVTCLQTNDSFQCKISEPMLGKSQHEVGPCMHAWCTCT